MLNFPETTTARQIQKNYRKIFDQVRKTKRPVVVMSNNKPDVVIVNVKELAKMQAILNVLESREQARKGQVKLLKSLKDLR